MDCPRCAPSADTTSPYRSGDASHLRRVALVRAPHPSGVELDRCPQCGGAFLEHGELERIQSAARSRGAPRRRDVTEDAVRRAYARARRPQAQSEEEAPQLRCPSCGEEMFEREWGYGSQILIDVCVECRGAWADGGEVEEIEQFFGAR